MKTHIQNLPNLARLVALVLLSTLNLQLSTFAQGTAFTYQGRLNDGASPANGAYDLTFALFNVSSGAGQIGGTLTNTVTPVSNGLFTVTLDFGANFPGADRWLEIGVRTNGGGAFTSLIPRQPITPSPYAIYSANAGTAGNVAGGFSGDVNGTQGATIVGSVGGYVAAAVASGASTANAATSVAMPGTIVKRDGSGNFSAATITASFIGNGTGLTNVNASTLDGLSSSNFWRTGGNAGTTPGTHFLGTTDNQPLEIKVNGTRGLRLEPNGGYVNVIGGFGNAVGFGVIGAVVAGGVNNTVAGSRSFVGGGSDNLAFAGFHQMLAGGESNRVLGGWTTLTGGKHNQVGGFYSSIGGGQDNVADEQWNVIGGGNANITTNAFSMTIAGGSQSRISSSHYAAIGGGWVNRILRGATGSVIGGGELNLIDGAMDATISGGYGNSALGNGATISGGTNNTISSGGIHATIGGGRGNTAANVETTVGGGLDNAADGYISTIGGGQFNQTSGQSSTIGGGAVNVTSGGWSTVPGGSRNLAAGEFSLAAGRRAKANHDGSFAWADDTDADFSSTTNKQFAVRASNGVMIQAANTALDLRGGGAVRVAGAGVGTGTPVFIHRAATTNISGHVTTIDHPHCNNDPNAILIVTPNWNPGGVGGVYNASAIGVYYAVGRWRIFNQDSADIATNAAFNVLVFKP